MHRHLPRAGAVLLALSLLAGCGGAAASRADRRAADAAYAEAERAFSVRDDARAYALFEAIARADPTPAGRGLALYRMASIRVREGRLDEAARLFASIDDPERRALGRYRSAVLDIERRDRAEAGREALRALAMDAPDRVAADKAVRYLARVDAAADAALAGFLGEVAARRRDHAVADNAAWWRAYVLLVRLNDLPGARAALRDLVETWPASPLLDDALWVLAELARRQGAFEQAVGHLEALLSVRNETSYLVGSYRSARLDDAALRVGDLHFHARRDFAAAARAYARCLEDFESSVVRDDAWWGLANARRALGDAAGAEQALRRLLAEEPDSRLASAAQRLLAGDASAAMAPDATRFASVEVRWP